MGIRLARKKARHWPLSIIYRIHRLLPISPQRKLDFYLDMERIADRLAMETSTMVYKDEENPIRNIDFLLAHLEPHHRVLDLGCANGVIANLISRRAPDVVGIDLNAALVGEARRRYPGLTFHVGDVFEYLEGSPPCDVIVLSHVLEHLDKPEEFLSAVKGKTRYLYIEVPDFEASHLNRMRVDRGRSLIYQDADHVAEFSRDELRDMLAAAGIHVEDEEYSCSAMRFWCTT